MHLLGGLSQQWTSTRSSIESIIWRAELKLISCTNSGADLEIYEWWGCVIFARNF